MRENMMPHDMPPQLIKDVFFDEGLVDLSHDIEQLDKVDLVDRFWSGLYLSCLPDTVRKYMLDEDISILDFTVVPTDYDIGAETVNVLLASQWIFPPDGHTKKGYAMYLSFHTDGTFECEYTGITQHYPESMIPHIRDLYAHTATWPGYRSLYPENFAD